MLRKTWGKLALIFGVLILLLALDVIPVLEGLPLLLIGLGLALVVTDRLRVWLHARKRVGLALLPFMVAALVLLLAFCRGRNLSQAILLLVTIGVVFDILLVALALIGEAGKRGPAGVMEFVALVGVGLLVGFVLSLLFLVKVSWLGGASLAKP